MRPTQHRIPSSIRVRRTDSAPLRNTYYSSADTYARRDDGTDANAQSINTDTGTPSRAGPSSSNDYFTARVAPTASIPTPGAEGAATTTDGVTPSTDAHWHTPPAIDLSDDEDDDDDVLRLEMDAARRAIYDQERLERRRRRGARSTRVPPGDYPPIRLSDEALQPRVPQRITSRRPGAVEGLAMRHHQQRRTERRRRRQAQRDSVSTSSSHSSSTDSRDNSAAEGNDDTHRGSHSSMSPDPPPHVRNLSDVQEERSYHVQEQRSSRLATPQTQDPPANADPEAADANSRPRRNTGTDEGFMATSRRLYDTLLRRKSDNALSADDPERQESPPRANDDDRRNDYHSTPDSESSGLHEDEVVDYLDVVDPEVATVTALQNVGNSIFFPPIPMLYNRRPTISLPAAANRPRSSSVRATPRDEQHLDDIEMGLRSDDAKPAKAHEAGEADESRFPGFSSLRRAASLVPGRKKKQVPPTSEEERRKHIREWAHMDEEERNQLDEHVRLLLTKKAKFKRAMRGFGRYVRTPHGLFITIYAFLITFWGTAICLFLLRWIDVGNRHTQRLWIEYCDQILCALFAMVGLGFAPFRAVDTYRMVQIVHYHRLTWQRRKQLNLPKLKDKNELPRAAPRLGMAQMTNDMMIKTGLRKGPEMTEEGKAVGGHSADGSNESRNGQTTTVSAESSSELLNPVESRNSACQVEALKEKRSKKHAWLRRKKHDEEKSHDSKPSSNQQKRSSAGTTSSSGSPEPVPIDTAHKSYGNKDGIIPLGQLKRNPSIASELPRDAEDVVVLSPKQQANLEYQQRKFHESHTFYRYRETVTHRPFELKLMMAIVILLDCHSCLQAALGGTTWGIHYTNRPTSVTATIITFSLSCNAAAGVLIWLGGSRTKKKEEVERLLGIALEEEALRKIRKKERRRRREEEQGEVEDELRRVNSRGRDGRIAVGGVGGGNGGGLESIQEH